VSGLFRQAFQVRFGRFAARESLVHIYQRLDALATPAPLQSLEVQHDLALRHPAYVFGRSVAGGDEGAVDV
jgi:hypothetical protein